MDSVTRPAGPRALASTAMRLRKVATIPIRTRRRPGPDAVHRPHDRARQHLALEARAARLRAGRARRRRLRDAELLADRGPEADASASCARSAAGSTCPTGWRYRVRRLRRELVARRQGRQGHDHPGRAAEHLPAREDHAAGRARARATRVSIAGTTQDGHAPTTPGTIEDHGTVTGTPFGRGSVDARRHARRTAASTGTFRLLFPRGSVHRHRRRCRSRSAATRSTSAAPSRFTGGTGAYRGITSGALAGARPQHARRPERGRDADGFRALLALR